MAQPAPIPAPTPLPRPPFLQRSLSYTPRRAPRPPAAHLHLAIALPPAPPARLVAYLAARAPDGRYLALAARELCAGAVRFSLRGLPRGDVDVVLVAAGVCGGRVRVRRGGSWARDGRVGVEDCPRGAVVRMGMEVAGLDRPAREAAVGLLETCVGRGKTGGEGEGRGEGGEGEVLEGGVWSAEGWEARVEVEGRSGIEGDGEGDGTGHSAVADVTLFSGFVRRRPEVVFARTDDVCPLCVIDCEHPATLRAHVEANHALVQATGVLSPRAVTVFSVERWLETNENSRMLVPLTRRAPAGPTQTLVWPHVSVHSWRVVEQKWAHFFREIVADLPACTTGIGQSCTCTTCRWKLGPTNIRPPAVPHDASASLADTDDAHTLSASSMSACDDGQRERCFDLPRVRTEGRIDVGVVAPLVVSARKKADVSELKRAARQTELYHIPAISRLKEDGILPGDADSEDECMMDDSFRLQIDLDALTALRSQSRSVKQRILWSMWNEFEYKKGAAGQFGDRYTRYSLELFVLTWRRIVFQLGLRIELLSFLHALHNFGRIDAPAVISVLHCLDGAKTIKDCDESKKTVLSTPGFNSAPVPKQGARASRVQGKGGGGKKAKRR